MTQAKAAKCYRCGLRPVSRRLRERYGIDMFCSVDCALLSLWAPVDAGVRPEWCAQCRKWVGGDGDWYGGECPHDGVETQ
jgi:hypothetical protein